MSSRRAKCSPSVRCPNTHEGSGGAPGGEQRGMRTTPNHVSLWDSSPDRMPRVSFSTSAKRSRGCSGPRGSEATWRVSRSTSSARTPWSWRPVRSQSKMSTSPLFGRPRRNDPQVSTSISFRARVHASAPSPWTDCSSASGERGVKPMAAIAAHTTPSMAATSGRGMRTSRSSKWVKPTSWAALKCARSSWELRSASMPVAPSWNSLRAVVGPTPQILVSSSRAFASGVLERNWYFCVVPVRRNSSILLRMRSPKP
mmetsp:Transcript_13717/g.42692  ORF Transcript_13717/g.42692 Transcript_13717/m.42692 type:complete len:256 (+) Transcript_13717:280-1047(+)